MIDLPPKHTKVMDQSSLISKNGQHETIQFCRARCSYCPVVQRWTMILEFLYCGCRTVINLSGEGILETDGWGVGGVWLSVVSEKQDMRH